ncbi:MAG: hypothetical protein ABI855_11065 [Bacteroidota bacterium]
MNKHEKAIQNQFAQTELQLGDFILTWEGSVPFKKIVDKWRLVREDLDENAIIQQISIRGLREFKLALQMSMAERSFKSRNAIQTYAMSQTPQDNALYDKVNIQESDLNHGNEEGCVERARIIERTARGMIGVLGTYGLVIGDVDSYLESIDLFKTAIPSVDKGIIAKKLATAAIKADVKNGRIIIMKEMKKGAGQFKDSAREFFNKLMESFQVNNLPTYRTEMDFTILEKSTMAPLPGTKVTAVAVKDPTKVVNQYAGMDGEADMQISPEMYNVTFEIPDHQTVTKTLEAKRGKKLKMQVELEKIPL